MMNRISNNLAAYFENREDGTYTYLRSKGCTAVRRGSIAAVRGARSAVDHVRVYVGDGGGGNRRG